MIRHMYIQLVVASSGVLWSFAATIRWRRTRTTVAALAVVALGQLCLWELVRRYDVVRVWTDTPSILAFVALASVLAAWSLLVRDWFDTPEPTTGY